MNRDRPSYAEARIEGVILKLMVGDPDRRVSGSDLREQFGDEASQLDRALARLEKDHLVQVNDDVVVAGRMIVRTQNAAR